MRRYNGKLLNSASQVMASVSVEVRFVGTTTKATIYSDEGITSITNPVTTDAFGRFGFFVADGVYDLFNVTVGTIANVAIVDPRRVVEVTLNQDVYVGLVNAVFNPNGSVFERRDTSKVAWALRYAGGSNDFVDLVRATAAANPITWAPIFRWPFVQGSAALVDVVNTITETDLASISLLANSLGSKNGLRLVMIGDYLNNSGVAANLTIRAKLGATTIATTGAISMAASATRRRILVVVELMAKGTTATQAAFVQVFVSAATADGVMEDLSAQTIQKVGWFLAMTVDMTLTQALKITTEHGTANALISARHLGSRIMPIGMAA